MKNKNEFQVHFIGIGAEKAGTTQVSEMLTLHPEICMSEPKEVSFFNKTESYMQGGHNKHYGKGLEWYKKHFGHQKEGQILGEFTTVYLYDKVAPKNIYELYPDVKLIVCLRNPVERTFSQYIMYRYFFQREKRSFKEVIRQEKEFIDKSKYFEQISRYLQYFKKEQMIFLSLEEIKTKPRETMSRLYDFLGVKADFVPANIKGKANAAKQLRFPIVNRITRITGEILADLNLSSWANYLKNMSIYQKFKQANSKKIEYPTIDQESKAYLQSVFLEDIEQLETLLNLNLSDWKL